MHPPSKELTHALLLSVFKVAVGIAVVVIIWESLIRLYDIPLFLAPPPSAVWKTILEKRLLLASHLGYTLTAALTGLLLSSAIAIALAAAFINSPTLSQATLPIVLVLRSAPVVAIAPLITLMVGRGLGTSVTVVVIVTFFPMLVNLMRGLSAADRNTMELMHVYGASQWQQLRLVRVPFSLPYFFAGLRVAGASAILGAMLAEWLTGVKGLGYLVLESADLREVELMWAAIAVSMAVAFALFWITAAAEKATLHWKI